MRRAPVERPAIVLRPGALEHAIQDDLDDIAATMLFPSDLNLRNRVRRAIDLEAMLLRCTPTNAAEREKHFREIRALPDFGTEIAQAIYCGEIAGGILLTALDGAKLTDAKARPENWAKNFGLNFGRSTVDNIWHDYRSVAHLWAARDRLDDFAESPSRALPCSLDQFEWFVIAAEALRLTAESFRPRQSSHPLLLPGEGYVIEAGFDLGIRAALETVAKE